MITPFASHILIHPRHEPFAPIIRHENRDYINDRLEPAIQIIPSTDSSVALFLELRRRRQDYPPPQHIVAEQLAAASAHQAVREERESLVWSPDNKRWEPLETHDTDWLLSDFLQNHADRRAGPWQHAKAQVMLCNLFHVRFPHAAPKTILSAHDIPTSVSSRDLSDLGADVPTCWEEPVKPFTVRYVDWDGQLRKVRIKPKPSLFKHIYANPKFPLNDSPICDDRKHYFAKERMLHEGVRLVKDSAVELCADALGGSQFKPLDDPLEYLQSFVSEDVPPHPTAPDPQARHEADKEKFAQHADELERLRGDYHQEALAGKLTRTQPEALKKLLANDGLKGPELSGLKWRAPKSASLTCPAEEEVDRTPFEEALRDVVDGDLSILNVEDDDYLRRKVEYGEVFRRFYGDNPDQQFPELTRDLYLFETALSKDWKSEAERKEWQRRFDRMYFFIHGVCPTGTCLNNRCANQKLSPNERLWTHAINLLQRVAPHKVQQLRVGTFYVVVVLHGQARLNLLKAKTAEVASTEFERLVESKVTRARAEARRQNKSEKKAEQGVRAAYRVADLLYVARETYPELHQQDIAAD